MNNPVLQIEANAKLLIIWMIKLYQKTFSFDHGFMRVFYPYGYCRFHPSCSQYAIDAFSKYGIFKASIKSMYRILRCNPWNKGGNDPA